ncbi:hypothetical protein XA68_17392 [Ophiocordyceps unilateralis]|uniref:Uncharacterized protein n=1 Tax=Ophiocordyceps unilateralis TaxID=268505 RepID=A0A2A9P418_OPHUN|nr:hypothetical protein XA68_17392 [Ophiocordyceps unilateralis]
MSAVTPRPTATPTPLTTRTVVATTTTTGAAAAATAQRLNLGPLTTVHQAPSRCYDRTLDTNVYATLDQGGSEFAQDLSMFVTDPSTVEALCPTAPFLSCLPRPSGAPPPRGTGHFFSPGLECPAGWQTVASVTGLTAPRDYMYVNGIVVSTLLPDENVVICCPSGFNYVTAFPPAPPVVVCSSVLTEPSSAYRYWSCAHGDVSFVEGTRPGAGYVLTVTATSGGHTNQIPVSYNSIRIYAPTIQLNYRSRDVRTTAASSPINAGPSLGGGAIAGIVVGAVAILLLLLSALMLCARRRRRSRPQAEDTTTWSKPELDGAASSGPTPLGPTRVRSELEARERHELDDTGPGPIYELGEMRRDDGEIPADAGAESRLKRWSGMRRGAGVN